MAIHVMRWTPNRCGVSPACSLIQKSDGVSTRIVGGRETTIGAAGVEVLRKCANHASVPDDELEATLHAEMKAVGRAGRLLAQDDPGLALTRPLDEGQDYGVSFTGAGTSRTLRLTRLGLTALQKEALATLLNSELGAGRVEVP